MKSNLSVLKYVENPSDSPIESYSKKLSKLISHYGYSQNQLAAKIGISTSVLSQILEQSYNYNPTNFVWTQIDKFLSKVQSNIYETKLLKKVRKMLSTCHAEKELIVVTSNSGAGKTTAIEDYCLKNPDAIHIRVVEVMTTKYLLERLCSALNTPFERLTNQQMYESIIDVTQRKNRLFVIDEAERLKVGQLELLRDVYDTGNVGLALIGLDSLRSLLQRGKDKRQDLVQLYSRVGYQQVVDILEESDVKMIFDDRLKKHSVSDNLMKSLAKTFESKGGLRAIIKLCNLILKYQETNKLKTIEDELVEHCSKQLTL